MKTLRACCQGVYGLVQEKDLCKLNMKRRYNIREEYGLIDYMPGNEPDVDCATVFITSISPVRIELTVLR